MLQGDLDPSYDRNGSKLVNAFLLKFYEYVGSGPIRTNL